MTSTDSKTAAHASNIYLFKNGYGMFVKTFEFPSNKDDGKPLELLDPPLNPVHGTFWVQSSSTNTTINSIRTSKIRTLVEKECSSVEDLLQGNIGEDVQLLITESVTKNKEWISGKIKSIKRAQDQLFEEEEEEEDSNSSPVQPGNLLLLETNDNDLLALSLSSIHSIRGARLKTTYQHKTMKTCLSIDYRNDSGSNSRGLMKYLTFGITWAPSYNLLLLSSKDPSIKKLRLSSKAVILNDIENLHAENLFCIVGFPNISKFGSVIDPIISGENVTQFLDHLKRCETSDERSLYYGNPSIMSNSIMTQQTMIAPTFNTDHPNDSQQDANTDDLHLYEFNNILLKKKERLMLPIFGIETVYKDVYYSKINILQLRNSFRGQKEKKDYEEVWHSVEFENVSNFVWTTAPVVITKGEEEQQFIAQDTLTYTLKGSTAFVNLTKALDVRVQSDEKVSSTNPTRFAFLSSHYQTDQIQGKLNVMNFKSEEVVVVINLSVEGKMSNYSISPKKDTIKVNENLLNEQHDIQWMVNVKPKQTLEIKYVRLYNKSV